MTDRLAILSGGMDSTTLAYLYRSQVGTGRLITVSFNYGQRHAGELEYAANTARALRADHRVVDLTSLTPHLKGSALTDPTVEVPEGHYADKTMKATVVPNRNAIMLSIAVGIAVAEKIHTIGIGVHAGDHPIYPDCRPVFIDAMTLSAQVGNDGFGERALRIDAPFINITKADIVVEGDCLGVPWMETWSCYRGGEMHCGKCGTCVERIEAFALSGVNDTTQYEA